MYRNICLVDTPYALSIYLLQMSMEDIKKTLFFIGDSVNVDIAKKLPHYVLVKNQSAQHDWKYMSWLRIYKYLKCFSYPFAKLYIQDHLYIASQFIGPYKYINLCDAPDSYSLWEKCPYQPQRYTQGTIKGKIKYYLAHGKMYDMKYGCNDQCVCRWITTQKDQETMYIRDKEFLYIDASQLWKEADSEKKEFVENVFGISDELLKQCQDIETLILTQPFIEDCHLSDKEMYDIYAPYIVNKTNVVIKIHPRDKFAWKKYFPNAYVIDTYAPMQLLNYMGLCPKEAITVSSTAISAMPEKTTKIFLGSKVNEKVFNTLGDLFNKQ